MGVGNVAGANQTEYRVVTNIPLQPLIAAASGGLLSLTLYPQWVAWKPIPPEPGKRWGKMLINPHKGDAADTADPSTWADYDTTLAYAQAAGLGVGFVFTADDPFFFVDIDECYNQETGWSPLANELCQRLAGAFVEVSVSGTGLHIIGVGQRPDGYKVKADVGFDIYTWGRFVALTGLSASGDASYDHTAEVQRLVTSYMKPAVHASPEQWSAGPVPEWSGYTDDAELIAAAKRSRSAANVFSGKATFKDLWEANTEALADSYPHETQPEQFDHSAADAALAQHLAFWTGKDCARIERLISASGLNREKWQKRQTYREETILGAVALCAKVHQTANMPAEMVNASVAPPPVSTAPMAPRYASIASGLGVYSDGKDAENAATFIQCWYPDGSLVFVQEQGYRYTGITWEAVSNATLQHEVTVAMWGSAPKDSAINSTISILKKRCTAPHLTMGEWRGRDVSHLVVAANGILDVHTGQLEPHNPSFFTTAVLPYQYVPGAMCPEWTKFLHATLDGDVERMQLLQEWMGYMLVTDYTHHKAMLLVGAPRSGKGTILTIIGELVGQRAHQGITLDGLANDAVMQNVLDKPVLTIGDAHSVNGPDRNRILDRFMSITGGDNMTITRKYKDSWSGTIPGRITMAANTIPQFFDDSGAFGNRLLLLPFNKSFLGMEDPTLRQRLLSELPGICNWAILGLQRLRATGRFTEPTISREERDEMMKQQAPLLGFVDDECELGEGYQEFSKELYNRYTIWCVGLGIRATSQSKFSRDFKATLRGKVTKAVLYGSGVTLQGFKGIRLRQVTGNVIPMTQTGGAR